MSEENEQLEFDFSSGSEVGYQNWQQENREKLNQISNEWSVPINRNVEIKLFHIPKYMRGRLILLEYPKKINHKREKLKLRLNFNFKDFNLESSSVNSIDFSSEDIEKWIILKDQESDD